MTKSKHTPLPWILEHDTDEGTLKIWAGTAIEERYTGIYDSAGKIELYDCVYDDCESDEEMIANAEFIIKAVNSHKSLISALEDIAELSGGGIYSAHDIAEAALSLIKE